MLAAWKQMVGFCRADSTPTASKPSGTTISVPVPCQEQSKIAQNDPIKFVRDFEPSDDANDLADVQNTPMQASGGYTPTNHIIPDAGTSSHGRQHEMSRVMAKLVTKRKFYSNRALSMDKWKQTSFTMCIWNFKNE